MQLSENHTAFSATCMKKVQVSEKLYDNQAGSRKDCALLTQLSENHTAFSATCMKRMQVSEKHMIIRQVPERTAVSCYSRLKTIQPSPLPV